MRPRIHFREEETGTKAAVCTFLIFAGVAWALLSASFSGTFAADSNSRVKAAQSALKQEQYLFEEPTGTLDDATRAALRRFQIRQGLPPTEEIDADTWQALQAAASPAPNAATATQSANVQKSAVPGVPAATVESDQQFLEQAQASGGKVAAEATPPPKSEPRNAPKQLAPPPIPTSAALGGTADKTTSARSNSRTRKSLPPLPPIGAAPNGSVSEENSQAEKPKASAKRRQIAAREVAAEPAAAEDLKNEPPAASDNRAREESVKETPRSVASASDRDQDYEGGVQIQRSRAPGRSRQIGAANVEASTADELRDESIPSRQVRGPSYNSVPEPERRGKVIANAPSVAPAAPAEGDLSLNAPPGSKITTYTTRMTGPDGRTTVERRTVVTPSGTEYSAPEVRRVEPVERSRERGFFHRLFRGD